MLSDSERNGGQSMRIVVAGVALLLSFLIGIFSYIILPYFELRYVEEEEAIEYKASTAMTIAAFFHQNNWKKWIVVSISSLLCTTVAWILLNCEIKWEDICKYMLIAMVLLVVMIIDWELHIIPNIVVGGLFFIGFIFLIVDFFVSRENFTSTILIKVASLAFCMVLFYALARLTKDGIGMGDVKIIATMAWILGLFTTLMVVLFALLICAGVSVVLLVRKRKDKNDTVPFGPFLFLGYILMLLLFGI